jgi:hypothetical protein
MIEKRKEFLQDILVTAVEGGIGYWSQVVKYDWKNCLAIVYAEGKKYTINEAVIVTALHKIIAGNTVVKMDDEFTKTVFLADRNNDGGDIDAVIADCII